jgi:hypothetical protein
LAIGSAAHVKAFLDFAQPATFEFMRESHIDRMSVGSGALLRNFFLPGMKNRRNLEEQGKIGPLRRQLEAWRGTAANGFRKNQSSPECGRPSSLVLFSPGFHKQIFSRAQRIAWQ